MWCQKTNYDNEPNLYMTGALNLMAPRVFPPTLTSFFENNTSGEPFS